MANAWKDHFLNEAETHKMLYDGVSKLYEQYNSDWDKLDLETAHWTEIANVIRWANSMARQSFTTGYGYFVNMIEHLKGGNIFTAKKRMESFAIANKGIADWTQLAVAKWDKLASEYGVTLVDDKNDEVEIALMADAALIDIYKYIGSKWNKSEAEELVQKVKENYKVTQAEFEDWKKRRNI